MALMTLLVPVQARLAGDWFPINERDMAVTISVVARSVRPFR